MIPGGVHISGICLTVPLSELNSHVDHIHKILSHIQRDDAMAGKFFRPKSTEKLVLVADFKTKKFHCKASSPNEPNSSFRSVEIKIRSFIDRWASFKTQILLSLETHLPSDRKKEKILHQLQAAVEPYLQSLVTETQLLINGELRQPDEKLLRDIDFSVPKDSDIQTKNSKKTSRSKRHDIPLDVDHSSGTSVGSKKYLIAKGSVSPAFAPLDVVIFGPQFPHWQRASSSSSLESGASSDTNMNNGNDANDSSGSFVPINRLVINGRIPGIAFLPANSSVGELLEALRNDLVRSILARLQLLTEELHITSAELEIPRMLLPQRVLVRLPACPALPLCDYKFLSETAEDVVNRLIYFCLPLGTNPTIATGDNINSDITHSSGNPLSEIEILSSHDRIDASCLDTTLEKSPELSADDEFSESELIDEVVETVPISSSFTSYNPVILVASLIVLVIAILLAYYFATQLYQSNDDIPSPLPKKS
ncbi:Protein odr-4 isoform 2 [Schistosoma japonicum]|uniref:Protein odr-4 isoform 2 n=1 Tax=Schistosoma japonicum TaxID=6182 RepID=A0A4Z2D811_SCHJA|nr:Protein odr-4 isoform 2 [Schistosoma japonicum]